MYDVPRIPASFRLARLTGAARRLVDYYEATDQSETAARWRNELRQLPK